MNVLLPSLSSDIIYYCITSLSTYISSTQNLYNFIINYSRTNDDYIVYQNKLINTDISNKLQVTSLLITDIIKKYHLNNKEDINLTEWVEKNYNLNIVEQDEFNVVSNIKNNNIISDLPKPLKLILQSTLEIITNIMRLYRAFKIK